MMRHQFCQDDVYVACAIDEVALSVLMGVGGEATCVHHLKLVVYKHCKVIFPKGSHDEQKSP